MKATFSLIATGAAVLAAAFLTTGCEQPHPHKRLNSPPQGPSEVKSEHQAFYRSASDNALLADMAIYEMHFMPHQATLTKAGECRVKRYAELLKDSGGTLAYESLHDDAKLNTKRLESIRRCLAECNAQTPIEVALGMSGAEGMDATQAIAARQTGTTVTAPKAGKSDSSGGVGSSSTGSTGNSSSAAPNGGVKE